jgi:hypothetical protein
MPTSHYGSSIRYTSWAAPDASDVYHHIDGALLAELTGSEMLAIRQAKEFERWPYMWRAGGISTTCAQVYGNKDFQMSFKPTVYPINVARSFMTSWIAHAN